MNILTILFATIVLFLIASIFYKKVLIRHSFSIEEGRATPAVAINDGKDYVPTKTHVVFGHHFATIAGAGPIIGPILAAVYGFAPVWLWLVLGCIFIGAVHDFGALYVSVREKGMSIAEIARKSLGKTGFVLFILFTILMMLLVTSSFLRFTAIALTAKWDLSQLGLTKGTSILKTVTEKGKAYGLIGGIASMSVIIVTLFAPMFGYLLYKKKIPTILAYIIAILICIFSVFIGIQHPITLKPEIWMIILSIYVLFAAGLPVWLILQPRDFVNVQILYIGILSLVGGIIAGGIGGLSIGREGLLPLFNIAEGVTKYSSLWPMMFILVACGAISGFHALVSTGTTAKQIANEKDTFRIGYNAMLLEGLFAICVLLAIAVGLSYTKYLHIQIYPESGKANPPLVFALAVGGLLQKAFGMKLFIGAILGILMLEGFMATTLDSAVRLNRYLFEELWKSLFKKCPRIMLLPWFNSALSVVLMCAIAFPNAAEEIWTLFGTANQLLAALTLIALSAWLISRKKSSIFTLVPAGFMLLTTIASLILFLFSSKLKSVSLLATDLFLLILSLGVVVLLVNAIIKRRVKSDDVAN